MSMHEFLEMGGYGMYVWPAYALSLTVLIVNIFAARSSHRRALEQARRRLQMSETNS